ncbi:class I SAM-dependent methyltransferase [Candidatus Bathyarchaeota archaeon]|nr:class I SAM-dependent methyltransferase [Candidatus Bathyarchaeota archaeon]
MASRISELYSLDGYSNNKVLRSIYDEWASSYDKEVSDEAQDYVAPALAGAYLLQALQTPRINGLDILDAGCGTGLVGAHLATLGGKVDGIDLSPGMLEIAGKTGAYRNLQTADLSTRLAFEDGAYDALTCVGTLTQGHVGPAAIDEFVRVVKKDGFVVVTILDAIFAKGGYEANIQGLVQSGKVDVVVAQMEDYRRGAGVRAWMIVLRVL